MSFYLSSLLIRDGSIRVSKLLFSNLNSTLKILIYYYYYFPCIYIVYLYNFTQSL